MESNADTKEEFQMGLLIGGANLPPRSLPLEAVDKSQDGLFQHT